MNIYNLALSLILLCANWLFVSSYVNIYKFFNFEKTTNTSKNILLVNFVTFIFLFVAYLIPYIYFEFNPIKHFELLPYFFLMIFIFWVLIIYSIYLFIFEKIKLIHILIVVLITIVNISFIYPILLSLAFDKYE